MKDILKSTGLVLLLNVVPAVFIKLAVSHYGWMTSAESTLLGLLIWLILTVSALLADIRSVKEHRAGQLALWDIQSSFDIRLTNIRHAYSRILGTTQSRPDLFLHFFDERLSELEHSITETANSNLLHLERSHVVSVDVLLATFTGSTFDVFRPIHFLSDNEFFFDMYARHYFNEVFKLVSSGRIQAVKRILIYANDSELEDTRSIRLMRFHTMTPGYEYRAMRLSDYTRLLHDYRLNVPRDFGIYGSRYLYCAVVNRSENIVGYWQRDPATVQRFKDFFEVCWRSPACIQVRGIDTSNPFSIDDLYS